MDKKQLSERDICTKFITPALRQAGWDELTQLREEVSFTKGRIIVRGKIVKRGKAKRADYILYYKPNIPLGVIEAKDLWADGGPTRLDNLTLLCRRHHRAVHEGGFTIVRRDEGTPVFYRPDGTCVEIAPPMPREEDIAAMAGRLIAPSVATGPDTAAALADDAPFDLAWAIDILRDQCCVRDVGPRRPTVIDNRSAGA